MFITQRYTLHHAILNLGEFTGHETFRKVGEIRVRDSCTRKRVQLSKEKSSIKHRSTVIRVKQCFKNG